MKGTDTEGSLQAKEPLSTILFTQHNLCFMQDFMRRLRQDILNDKI